MAEDKLSCISCYVLDSAGREAKPLSLSHRGKQLDIKELVPERVDKLFAKAFLHSLASETRTNSESGAEAIGTSGLRSGRNRPSLSIFA